MSDFKAYPEDIFLLMISTTCPSERIRRRIAPPPQGRIETALAAEADRDRGEGAVEVAVVGFARVYAAIHRAEEGVYAIAEADFCIRKPQRETGKAADVRHDDGAGTCGVVDFGWVDCWKRSV